MALKRRRSYVLTLKVKVIQYAEAHSITRASNKFKIDRKTIRHWIRKKANIFMLSRRTIRRRCQRKCSCKWPLLEEDLYDWIIEMRAAGQCVSGNMVKDRALQMANSVEFRASNGWLQNFLMRRRLVRRRVTTSGRDLPADAVALARGFLESAVNKYCLTNFARASLLNMDETCLYLDESSI